MSNFDFTDAILVQGPHTIRDGGSISIVVDIDGVKHSARYAGGFEDILEGRHGKIEVCFVDRDEKKADFFDPSELKGWREFIAKNTKILEGVMEQYLGKSRLSEEQKKQVFDLFGTSKS